MSDVRNRKRAKKMGDAKTISTGISTVYVDPNNSAPLVASVDPITGIVTITHANSADPETGAPIYSANAAAAGASLLDSKVMGVPTSWLLFGGLAYFLFKKK